MWPLVVDNPVLAAILALGALVALGYTARPLGYKYAGLGDLPVLLDLTLIIAVVTCAANLVADAFRAAVAREGVRCG